ncbi:MAG: ribonuclease D [Steroidobacteraceae bacterium]
MSTAPITDGAAIGALATRLAGAPRIGLDTEFMRERTYRPQLCLLQMALPGEICCIDPLAEASLEPLAPAMRAPQVTKIIHAARQDLEVLWPLFGSLEGVFDTQIAAALTGLPAQIGYSDLVNRLLGVHLAKAETRTDWSRRPLTAAQLTYAAEDVAHLEALHAALVARLKEMGRLAWLQEELEGLALPGNLFVDPERAWERLRWAGELDEDRRRLLGLLAAWRERRAAEKNRPRSWILDDAGLRNLVLQAPRDMAALMQVPELTPGFVERSGAALLEVIDAAALPARLPPPPSRPRPDPEKTALVKRLSAVVQTVAGELKLSPEILATRRELEQIASSVTDVQVLRGWRREVIGERLLAGI